MIVAGSRDINDYMLVRQEVINYIDMYCELDIEIVTGMANGIDDIAYHLARWDLNIPYRQMPADWGRHANSAGYIRNTEMATYAAELGGSCLLAFWDGVSKGTKHMIDIALKHKLRVIVVFVDVKESPISLWDVSGQVVL